MDFDAYVNTYFHTSDRTLIRDVRGSKSKIRNTQSQGKTGRITFGEIGVDIFKEMRRVVCMQMYDLQLPTPEQCLIYGLRHQDQGERLFYWLAGVNWITRYYKRKHKRVSVKLNVLHWDDQCLRVETNDPKFVEWMKEAYPLVRVNKCFLTND